MTTTPPQTTQLNRLFVVQDRDIGTYSMLFFIPPCPERKELTQKIKQNGGAVVAEPGCSIYQLKVEKSLDPEHQNEYACNLVYDFKWVQDSIKKNRILPKKNYIVPNFTGKRQVVQYKQNFTILECLKMYDTVEARVKENYSKSLSFWKAIEKTGFFPCRTAQSLLNRWKFLSKIQRSVYLEEALKDGSRFCNALATIPHFSDRHTIERATPTEEEPDVKKKPKIVVSSPDFQREEKKKSHHRTLYEENGDNVDEENQVKQEEDEEEQEEFAAPVGQFTLDFKPRMLRDDFTDSNLQEEKSFISGRVTPSLLKKVPLMRFGTILPIRHASVTWVPNFNDTLIQDEENKSLSSWFGSPKPKKKTNINNSGKVDENTMVFVDSKKVRVLIKEDQEATLFKDVDKKLHELIEYHPGKTYAEMLELLEEVSGNIEDLEELLDGNDDIHQWDELQDLAVLKEKGSKEYKAIVKKMGERQVIKRRNYLTK